MSEIDIKTNALEVSPIIIKILEDARAMAASTAEEGQKSADAVLQDAASRAESFLAKQSAEDEALAAEIVKRRLSVANLEVKKLRLRAKKEVLDEAFRLAEQKICTLPKDRYAAYIASLLALAADGDAVKIAAGDKKRITKKMVEDAGKARGIRLTLSSETADIAGGIILTAGNMDKNMAVEVEMAALREEIEGAIAKKVFGE